MRFQARALRGLRSCNPSQPCTPACAHFAAPPTRPATGDGLHCIRPVRPCAVCLHRASTAATPALWRQPARFPGQSREAWRVLRYEQPINSLDELCKVVRVLLGILSSMLKVRSFGPPSLPGPAAGCPRRPGPSPAAQPRSDRLWDTQVQSYVMYLADAHTNQLFEVRAHGARWRCGPTGFSLGPVRLSGGVPSR
jgi:hypothetical protein